jgi:hypothetical protein
VSSSFTNDQF